MKEEVERKYPDRQITVEFLPLDMASFASVKEFTVAFREKNLPLHLLINNAGIALVPLSEHCACKYSYTSEAEVPAYIFAHKVCSVPVMPTCVEGRHKLTGSLACTIWAACLKVIVYLARMLVTRLHMCI